MPWGSDRDEDLRQMFQQLISLRKTTLALTGHKIEILHAEGRSFAFSRGPDTLVIINADSQPWRFTSDVHVPSNWEIVFQSHENNQGFQLVRMSTTVLTRIQS